MNRSAIGSDLSLNMPRNSEQILTEWLVLHAQNGSAVALERLLRIWYPKLRRYAANQLQNEEAAKDVVQETLLTVARRIGRLKDPAAFPKWAYQILQRRGIDYQRREIRSRRPGSGEPGAFSRGDIDDDFSTRIDARIAIERALSDLSEESYRIVHLRYLTGLSLKEIATVIGIPEGTVKSRLHTARLRLKSLLTE